jgi:hypothetical protein
MPPLAPLKNEILSLFHLPGVFPFRENQLTPHIETFALKNLQSFTCDRMIFEREPEGPTPAFAYLQKLKVFNIDLRPVCLR